MYPAPPCDYKRRRRASLRKVGQLSRHLPLRTHALTPSSDIVIRHAQTPLLAETWELPSLSRPACTPYYKHSGCKIIQCTRTPPLLDVRPRGRNQDKPVRYCVACCINIWDEETRSIASWNPDRRVRTPTRTISTSCKKKMIKCQLKGLMMHGTLKNYNVEKTKSTCLQTVSYSCSGGTPL